MTKGPTEFYSAVVDMLEHVADEKVDVESAQAFLDHGFDTDPEFIDNGTLFGRDNVAARMQAKYANGLSSLEADNVLRSLGNPGKRDVTSHVERIVVYREGLVDPIYAGWRLANDNVPKLEKGLMRIYTPEALDIAEEVRAERSWAA